MLGRSSSDPGLRASDDGIPRAHGQPREGDQNKRLKECSSKSLLYPMLQNDAAERKTTSSRNACAANRIRESALARAVIRPPSIAPITNAMSAVEERATDSPDTRAVANARIKMFPVMFAVKTLPRTEN